MAFYLVISLGATAGLFFLAGADFVGAMQLMIYVGGTLVLLIFGVMLTSQQRIRLDEDPAGDWIVAAILVRSLLGRLLRLADGQPVPAAGDRETASGCWKVGASRHATAIGLRLGRHPVVDTTGRESRTEPLRWDASVPVPAAVRNDLRPSARRAGRRRVPGRARRSGGPARVAEGGASEETADSGSRRNESNRVAMTATTSPNRSASSHYLVVGAVLFVAGVVCMATKRNALGVLMGIELVLNGANVNFVAFGSQYLRRRQRRWDSTAS